MTLKEARLKALRVLSEAEQRRRNYANEEAKVVRQVLDSLGTVTFDEAMTKFGLADDDLEK